MMKSSTTTKRILLLYLTEIWRGKKKPKTLEYDWTLYCGIINEHSVACFFLIRCFQQFERQNWKLEFCIFSIVKDKLDTELEALYQIINSGFSVCLFVLQFSLQQLIQSISKFTCVLLRTQGLWRTVKVFGWVVLKKRKRETLNNSWTLKQLC